MGQVPFSLKQETSDRQVVLNIDAEKASEARETQKIDARALDNRQAYDGKGIGKTQFTRNNKNGCKASKARLATVFAVLLTPNLLCNMRDIFSMTNLVNFLHSSAKTVKNSCIFQKIIVELYYYFTKI